MACYLLFLGPEASYHKKNLLFLGISIYFDAITRPKAGIGEILRRVIANILGLGVALGFRPAFGPPTATP